MPHGTITINNESVTYKFINKRIYNNLVRGDFEWKILSPSLDGSSPCLIGHYIWPNVYLREARSNTIESFTTWELGKARKDEYPPVALAFNINRQWQRDIVELYILRNM